MTGLRTAGWVLCATPVLVTATELPLPAGITLTPQPAIATVSVSIEPDWFESNSPYTLFIRLTEDSPHGVKRFLGEGRIPHTLLTPVTKEDHPPTVEVNWPDVTGLPPTPILAGSDIKACTQLILNEGGGKSHAQSELNCATLTPTEP